MTDHDTDILVVGAGPTGLTFAAELARHGITCRIIDKADGPTTVSKAIAIHARTLETFERMGCIADFMTIGHKVTGLRVHADSRQIMHIHLDDIESLYAYTLTVPQSETERLLTERLQGFGVTVERPTELTTFEQDDTGVTAYCTKDDAANAIRARWIAGCDGAHSIVRHTLGLSFTGAAYAEGFALADCKVDWDMDNREAYIFICEGGLAALFPMARDRWRVILEGRGVPSGDAPITIEDCQKLLDARISGLDRPAVLSDAQWISGFHVHRRIVDRMKVGRAFLIGDAADIHSPAGGQGMNTGIQSAFNLAWKIALVAKGMSPESILESYQAERHPVEQDVLRSTDFMTRFATSGNPITHWMRDAIMPILSRQDFVQHRITSTVSEIGVAYHKSPIIEEHRTDGNVRAGNRAPDAPITPLSIAGAATDTHPSCRLFEVLDPIRHTLMVLSGTVARQARAGDADAYSESITDGMGVVMPSYSGLGGMPAFASVDPSTLRATAFESLYNIVTIAADIGAGYSDLIKPILIVRDADQTHGIDWRYDSWVDPDGALHDHYGFEPSLYLVRPDGYVGFRSGGADVDRVKPYLERLFLQKSRQAQ